ncbi:MAG: endonuclease domain-containing protein, partial [Actinomycetota bacterium]|nr:endonuclease domain-containing protein [Actinomycetota bacterium]
PLPQRQYKVPAPGGGVIAVVDFAYPEAKVAIETDGWSFHSTKAKWQRDATKANDLAKCGWSLLRFTYPNLREGPDDVVARTAHAIGMRLFP